MHQTSPGWKYIYPQSWCLESRWALTRNGKWHSVHGWNNNSDNVPRKCWKNIWKRHVLVLQKRNEKSKVQWWIFWGGIQPTKHSSSCKSHIYHPFDLKPENSFQWGDNLCKSHIEKRWHSNIAEVSIADALMAWLLIGSCVCLLVHTDSDHWDAVSQNVIRASDDKKQAPVYLFDNLW